MKIAPENVRRAANVNGWAYFIPTFITTQL